jgi:dienelactone hydrolase
MLFGIVLAVLQLKAEIFSSHELIKQMEVISTKNVAQAIQFGDSLLQLNIDSAGQVHTELGWLYLKRQNSEKALESFNYAKEIFNQIGHDNFSLNILGFSQGGATACRWAFSSDMKVNNLILWAGDIPGDTLTVENKEKWASINTHLIMGNQDYLIPEEMKVKFLKEIQNYGIDFSSTKYEGGHKIYPEVLLKFSKSL